MSRAAVDGGAIIGRIRKTPTGRLTVPDNERSDVSPAANLGEKVSPAANLGEDV